MKAASGPEILDWLSRKAATMGLSLVMDMAYDATCRMIVSAVPESQSCSQHGSDALPCLASDTYPAYDEGKSWVNCTA